MSEELAVLKEVARRLDETGIAYMVTGSTAANFYAMPRMTRDIDIVVELSERDIGKFIQAFEKDHYIEPDTVRDAVKNKRMFNLIHNQYIIKVDFIVRKDTPYRRREFSRKKKISVEGQDLYVVAAEDLILSKLEWAKGSKSEVQLSDVQNLLRSVKRLDRALPGPMGETVGCGVLISEGHPMKDTSDAMEQKYRDMLLQRSGEERLKMGCSMHATVQALVRAAALQADPSTSHAALRKMLFLRFYGQDFAPEMRKRILRALGSGATGR